MKKKKKGKKKKVSILSDNSTGRGDAVTLPPSSVLKSKPKLTFPLVDMTSTAAAVQPGGQGMSRVSTLKEQVILRKEMSRSRNSKS